MITNIHFNKYQLYGKIIFSIVLIFILAFIGRLILFPRPIDHNIGLACTLFVFLVFGLTLMLIPLLLLPTGVTIDETFCQLEIKFLVRNTKTIYASEIKSYGSTIIITKSTRYEGILLHLTDHETILLSDFNLKDYRPILRFLDDSEITYLEKERFRFISYYRQSAKFF
jgi:hypothetical protein